MVIHPIKTEEDYNNAMLRIDALMDSETGTEEGDEPDVLATLVEAYERVPGSGRGDTISYGTDENKS